MTKELKMRLAITMYEGFLKKECSMNDYFDFIERFDLTHDEVFDEREKIQLAEFNNK